MTTAPHTLAVEDRDQVVALLDCDDTLRHRIGAEAAALGALARVGFAVPHAFVVTADAYRDWVGVQRPSLRDGFCGSVTDAYAALSRAAGTRELLVAVRPTRVAEEPDEPQPVPPLPVTIGADAVLGALEECWLAAGEDEFGVAVLVQEVVDARVAGVLCTEHPVRVDSAVVTIEAGYGIHDPAVDLGPDVAELEKFTGRIRERRMGAKSAEHRITPDRRAIEARPVDDSRRQDWALDHEDLNALLTMAIQVQTAFGHPMRLEWALGTTSSDWAEELFILGAAPLERTLAEEVVR